MESNIPDYYTVQATVCHFHVMAAPWVFAHPENPGRPTAPVDDPATVPDGALVFDSFSRRNSTYAFGEMGGLGATEGGTLGPQNWLSGVTSGLPGSFGILNGKAVTSSNGAAVTWIRIPAPHAGFDIRVDRHASNWGSGQNTAISFRVADVRNYFFAYSSEGADGSQPKTLTVGYYLDALRTDLATMGSHASSLDHYACGNHHHRSR